MEESVFETLARNGVVVMKDVENMGDKMKDKEHAEENTDKEEIDDDNTSTEKFVEEIVKVLTPKESENVYENVREKFDILMPTGELKKVDLFPADTLKDYNKVLSKRFGDNCLLFGVKKGGVTRPPKINYCVGMYNTKYYREQLAIVFKSNM